MNARRRMRRRKSLLIVSGMILLAGVVTADHLGLFLVADTDDMAAYHGRTVSVVRVVDGDTIEIDVPDALAGRPTTSVRLIGLDAPEQHHDRAEPEPLADEATDFVRKTINGQNVTLRLESHRTRGSFGRVLAHVELPDGRLLNELILEAGLAQLEERWPHNHLVTYAQRQQTAQQREVGLWAEDDLR